MASACSMEQADAIEILRLDRSDEIVEFLKFFVVERPILIGFGFILGQHAQLTHPV